ncbi:MAG TPA: protein kinase [Kofleriaceae bacterium]|jgi:tetratricopeptide (TPR) repeat protein
MSERDGRASDTAVVRVEDRPGALRRLIGWLRGDRDPPAMPAPESPAEPAVLGAKEELWLQQLAEDAGEERRLDAIGGEDFWSNVEALWSSGHERLSLSWIEKFVAVPSVRGQRQLGLRVRLVELYERRGDLADAVAHLEALTREEAHATRAHYLMAEHFRRTGNEGAALRHYEAVLARDVAYPNVRARLDRLRAQRGAADAPALGATMAGVDSPVGSGGARYRLLREIGRGATGVVYLARDAELERDVAVKLLHPHLASAERAEACARFFAEARLAASLRHPNIVAILDLDEASRRIVMELAHGGTMRELLRERGPRPLRRGLERHAQILSALAAAHRRGIVHRDLKPANLMYRRDPDAPGSEVMLGDFGVAHLPADAARPGTPSPRGDGDRRRGQRDAVGTLAYMAPEQRKLGEASPKSDLYASAVVLYEMLTGRYPWPPHLLLGGARKRGDFLLPSQLRDKYPAGLVAAVQSHLDDLGDPDASVRPDTAGALALAIALRDRAIAEAI